jgi:large subunit ribosomal protein L32
MAVPRNRSSNARRKSRASHFAKIPKNTIACSNCKAPILAHRICPDCGYYAKKEVIHVKGDKKE